MYDIDEEQRTVGNSKGKTRIKVQKTGGKG